MSSSSPKDSLKEAAKGNLEPLKQQIPTADQVKANAQQSLEKVKDAVPTSKEELKEAVEVTAKKSMQSLRDFVAGGVGGVCAVVVGHPFDLVKVRLQTAEKGVYTGAMDVVRKTIAREGPVRVRLCCMCEDCRQCADIL
jgi:solute carrier family 25 carnitine/acylcarnitine transporter 20/29